jgi:hypothetical protein
MGTEAWSHWKRNLPTVTYITLEERSKKAEVYVIHYNGKAPIKVEEAIMIPMPDHHIMKIAFPRYEERTGNISSSVIHASGTTGQPLYRSRSVLAEHIGRIAMKNLDNRMARVKAKAIARATAKYVAGKAASDEIREKQGDMAGLFADVLTTAMAVATERPDLRCWRTLPAEIRIAKLMVQPGDYNVTAECLGQHGNIVRRRCLGRYTMEAGDKQFIIFHTFD